MLTKPVIQVSLDLAKFSARELLSDLGIALDTADPEVLKQVSMKALMNVKTADTQINIEELKVGLDDSLLTGKASATPGELLIAQFDMNLDQIDLDRYLPPLQKRVKVQKTMKPISKKLPQKLERNPLRQI